MAIKVSIQGQNDEIILEKDNIDTINYISDTPNNSNARATDLSVSIEIIGKIISDGSDVTKKLSLWSLVPAESNDAYRKVSIEVISAGLIQRKIIMPNGFIVDYLETFDTKSGAGQFKMLIKQKKEKIESISIEGGYSAG